MKGVILAGGTGSRLRPLTDVTNKHLLPVYDRPMIFWSIETMREAGITDILIISGPNHAGHFLNLLGSGKKHEVKLTYEVQEEAGGIAQAMGLAEDFVDEGPVAVLLGDNILERTVKEPVQAFADNPVGAKIFLTEVDHPEWYGIAEMQGDKVGRIIEKPQPGQEPSRLAVIGLYLYDHDVFDIIKNLQPSARGELEVTDVNNAYLQAGKLQHAILEGWWADAGESFTMYLKAQNLAASKAQPGKN
ncbi:MAG: sugar phosphate nucleotidyltransferase [Candidatus Andersenbacteria bacterium]